jgi:hypothetical protein
MESNKSVFIFQKKAGSEMALPFLFISFGNHQIQGKPVLADK